MINASKLSFNLSFGLRSKVVLLSSFLFAIPWLGWVVREFGSLQHR